MLSFLLYALSVGSPSLTIDVGLVTERARAIQHEIDWTYSKQKGGASANDFVDIVEASMADVSVVSIVLDDNIYVGMKGGRGEVFVGAVIPKQG